ncbi:MAG TPA: hypothetical protein VF476_02080 [Chitinophagaceae bacterium]
MKYFILIAFLLPGHCYAQTAPDSIKLNFLYGSIPAKGHKKSEPKWFGGIKGGHVNIEANGMVIDFRPGNPCAIFPNNKKPGGGFHLSNSLYWDTATTKWISISIPVTKDQLTTLTDLFTVYAEQTPYDYAVFGMRCAAASYDLLSEIGIVKKLSDKNNIMVNFYPKLLRKRMLKWAKENNYPITYHDGRATRKWESDSGLF